MNDQLSINGSIKDNLFNKLKNNKTVKHLEISYGNVDDDWHLIGELNQLVSLSIKDSFVDFQSFYGALAKLKNLEQITYNYYCFFNKQKNDQLKNIIINIKTFQIDFPKDDEPDFDFNNYLKKTYKKKFHSIFEIKDCENIFVNLEEVIFVNYQKFKTLVKEFDSTEIKLFEKILYSGMEFSNLKKFKFLKNIKINNGTYLDLLEMNLNKFLNKIDKSKTNFLLNGLKKEPNQFDTNIKSLEIIYSTEKATPSLTRINSDLINDSKNFNIEEFALSINEKNLYSTDFSKPFKLLKDKNNSKILKNNFETIIFSKCYGFLDNENAYRGIYKKIKIYKDILNNQLSIKNIIFDFSKSDEYKTDIWTSSQFSFLIKFIYEINKSFPHIKFLLFHKKNLDDFKIHLLYIYNSIKNNNLQDNVEFIPLNKIEIQSRLEENIKNNKNIIIVDDIFYNATKHFPDLTLIYHDQISDLKEHFPKYYEDKYMKNWNKIDLTFKENFSELLRIIGFQDLDFKPNTNNLILLIKKNYLKNLKGCEFTKLYCYLGSPAHMLTHNLQHDEKKWKSRLKLTLTNESPQEINIIKNKYYKYAELSAEEIVNSSLIDSNKITKNDLLTPTEKYEIINDLAISKDCFQKLTHCWFEGVVPWQQKYLKLNKLANIIPTGNLENLKLSDCIFCDDLNLPFMPKLKILKLAVHPNHHAEINTKKTITKFENCQNLETIAVSKLYSLYNKNLFNITFGDLIVDNSLSRNDTYSYVSLDLSKLHELKKLKELNLSWILASDIKAIKALPNLKKLNINIMHHTKEDHLSSYDAEPEVNDKDLLFFKESKKLEDMTLSIGEVSSTAWGSEQPYSSYNGDGEFLNYINHKIEKIDLQINFSLNNQIKIQDVINKITNRFLNLKILNLEFGISMRENDFDMDSGKYLGKIQTQIVDFSKLAKLSKLTKLTFQQYSDEQYIPFKTINFESIIKLKKIRLFQYCWNSVSSNEIRKARIALKNENYDNPEYYDSDFSYYADEDEEYKNNWNRMPEINTEESDWISFETRLLDLEKEINEKKYKKTTIIKKKS